MSANHIYIFKTLGLFLWSRFDEFRTRKEMCYTLVLKNRWSEGKFHDIFTHFIKYKQLDLLYSTGKWNEFFSGFDVTIHSIKKSGISVLGNEILRMHAFINIVIGKPDTGIKILKKILSHSPVLDVLLRANIYLNLGVGYAVLKKYHKAIRVLNTGLKFAQKHLLESNLDAFYGNLGRTYTFINKPEEAIECFNRALSIARRGMNQYSLVRCYIGLGMVNANLKKYRVSISYFVKAHSISIKMGDISLEADVILKLTQVFINCGKKRKAFELLKRCRRIAKGVHHPYFLKEVKELEKKLVQT